MLNDRGELMVEQNAAVGRPLHNELVGRPLHNELRANSTLGKFNTTPWFSAEGVELPQRSDGRAECSGRETAA
jgi:hypothetical protein